MNEAAFQKFQTILTNQGVSPDDAVWLANLWGELGEYLKMHVGLGAQAEGDEVWVFVHVPTYPDGIRISMSELESMDNPVGELGERLRALMQK